MTAIRDAIDAGGAAGKLEICSPGLCCHPGHDHVLRSYGRDIAPDAVGGDVRAVGEADVGAACCYDGTEKY